MATDAHSCPNCGYFELSRSPDPPSLGDCCPRCRTRSIRLDTPVVYTRMHPVIGREWAAEWREVGGGRTTFRFLDALVAVRADVHDTDGKIGVTEFWAARGHGSPVTVHAVEDEGYLVLDGEIEWRRGEDSPRRCRAGEFVWAPRGVAHAYTVSSSTACFLCFTAPAGLEAFFRAAGSSTVGMDLPTAGSVGPEEIDRLEALASEYGIRIAGPPPGLSPVDR